MKRRKVRDFLSWRMIQILSLKNWALMETTNNLFAACAYAMSRTHTAPFATNGASLQSRYRETTKVKVYAFPFIMLGDQIRLERDALAGYDSMC
jgi:hypothetical protein